MKTESNSTKTVVTVSEMAAMCRLSRSRWYEMVDAGVFPKPVQIPSVKRPVYDQQLIEKCLEIRSTGVGLTGPVSFNRKVATRAKQSHKKTECKPPADPQIDQIMIGIKALGINATYETVRSAVVSLNPCGTAGMDRGELIRQVFIYLQTKKS